MTGNTTLPMESPPHREHTITLFGRPLRVRIAITVSAIMVTVSLATSAVMSAFLIPLSTDLAIEEAREKVLALAMLSQSMINPRDSLAIRVRADQKGVHYQKLHLQLSTLVRSVNDVGYAYIWRLRKYPGSQQGFRAFWVVDNEPFDSKMFKPVGTEYPLGTTDNGALEEVFRTGKAAADKKFYSDYAGTWISGYAPIHVNRLTGEVEVIGVDISAKHILASRQRIGREFLLTTLYTALLMVPLGILVSQWMCRPLKRIVQRLRRLSSLDLCTGDPPIPAAWVVEIQQLCEAIERLNAAMSSFALYLPREVVRKLLEANEMATQGGTSQQIAIMFTDIRDFTGYAESTPLAVLLPRLNEYLTQVGHQISREDGTIDKYIGDAVMAFWGAPSKVDRPALRACRSALAIQDICTQLNRRWEEEGIALNFSTCIGLHIGTAIVGNFGSDDRINYTAIGDNVNLANRLESATRLYDTNILVSRSIVDAVLEETKGEGELPFEFDRIDAIHVKGKRQAVEVFSLRSRNAPAERLS